MLGYFSSVLNFIFVSGLVSDCQPAPPYTEAVVATAATDFERPPVPAAADVHHELTDVRAGHLPALASASIHNHHAAVGEQQQQQQQQQQHAHLDSIFPSAAAAPAATNGTSTTNGTTYGMSSTNGTTNGSTTNGTTNGTSTTTTMTTLLKKKNDNDVGIIKAPPALSPSSSAPAPAAPGGYEDEAEARLARHQIGSSSSLVKFTKKEINIIMDILTMLEYYSMPSLERRTAKIGRSNMLMNKVELVSS